MPPPLDPDGRDGASATRSRWPRRCCSLLAAPLIDLPGPYRLLAAMPCGLNSLIVSHAYGLDMRIVAEVGHLDHRDRRRRGVLAAVLSAA